ncbi:hypothetical protein PAXINDRAFT_165447 [Paxillus involutus ATCC 200175]|nr:hypothetical protein PAXINDRAFT_165447 [Paxillus involutus ATCC 200175]
MLVLPTLHKYLSQLLSPPSIHTALLLTPEGALVSYASRMDGESGSGAAPQGVSRPSSRGASSSSRAGSISQSSPSPSPPQSKRSSTASSLPSTPQPAESVSTASGEIQTHPARPRSKDDIRIIAGLSAEVWAETRDDETEGMAESELGRILVLPVEVRKKPSGEEEGEGQEPLLLLALNGTLEADWEVMSTKAYRLVAFLAPSVNKHRGLMQAPLGTPGSLLSGSNGSKSRTRSTGTSPGRGINR